MVYFELLKTTMHEDGVPRIDVQLAMDSELTSFQHVIEKPEPLNSAYRLDLLFLVYCS